MKKSFFVILVIFITFVNVNAQDRPFIGYDRVAWGSSVSQVQQVYSIQGISPSQAPNDPNITFLLEQFSSGNISNRRFDFLNDRLYQVVVFYREGSDSNHDTIRRLLEQRYGTATSIDVQTGSVRPNILMELRYRDTYSIFGRFAPDIEVRLLKRVWTDDNTQDVAVFYIWKQLKDEYDASRLGL